MLLVIGGVFKQLEIMLPRMSSVRRVVFLVGCFVVCGWVWLSSPISAPVDIPSMPVLGRVPKSSNELDNNDNKTRISTPAKPEVINDDKQSHHHSNQTLEKLRKNMTLLKANMSGVESLMINVNKTRREEDDDIHKMNGEVINVTYANPHPFRYIINTKAVCQSKDIFLIVYVHTAPDHYKRRMIIRQTWGNSKYYDVSVRVVFVMGFTPNNTGLQQALLFEAEQYSDIVQEDFHDTYKNLTYKGVAGLKWISNNCAHAKFVLKSDDDIFVNMFTLLRHLVSLERLGVDNKGTLLCLVWYRMTVMRTGKWKISKEEWSDDYYPTYCSGSAFTMTIDVAVAMHNVSYHVPFFWVDDFYITGLLPLKLHGQVKHKQFMSTYVLDGKKLEEKFTGPQWFTYIFSHVHDLNAIQSVWDRLLKLTKGEILAPVKFALPGQLPKEEPNDDTAKKKP